MQLCSAFTPWTFPAVLRKCILPIFLKKKKHLFKKKIPLTGRAVATYSLRCCGESPLASFVLSCGRAAERSIATNWGLVMKYFHFIFPRLENTDGSKLPLFVHRTAAWSGSGADGGVVLGGRESPERWAALGSGVPRLGVPCSTAATPDQPGLGYPRLCCFIFHKLRGGFWFHCTAGRKIWATQKFCMMHH